MGRYYKGRGTLILSGQWEAIHVKIISGRVRRRCLIIRHRSTTLLAQQALNRHVQHNSSMLLWLTDGMGEAFSKRLHITLVIQVNSGHS